MPLEKRIVRGKIFNPLSRTEWDYIPNGALIVNENGRIESIGEYNALRKAEGIRETLDYSNYLILPGMIDTHIHLPQLPIRGKNANSLLEWLEKYAFPVEEAFADLPYASRLAEFFFESLKANGTTTALAYSSMHEGSTHVAFEAAQQSGMRVIMGKVMMDQNSPKALTETAAESIAASERLAKTWHRQNNDLLRYAFTPRFALSCSQELLEAAGDLCQRFPESYIQSHLSENMDEIEAVERMHGYRLTYAQVYEEAGCLGPRTIMAHGIHLTPEEMAILLRTETRIAHCPTSNFFLKSGFFNLPAIRRYCVPFGLGTDVGGGPDLCLFRVMRAMDEMQLKHQLFVPATEALYYGTLAGAEVLSLAHETGNLLPGKSADFIVINTDALNPFTSEAQSIEDILSQLVYLGGAEHILRTFIRGEEVYRQPETNLSRALTRYRSTLASEPLFHQP